MYNEIQSYDMEGRNLDYPLETNLKVHSPSKDLRVNRKRCAEDNEYDMDDNLATSDLSDRMKKFRLTTTPGEIRFGKDMNEIKNESIPNCEISQIDSSSVLVAVSINACQSPVSVMPSQMPTSEFISRRKLDDISIRIVRFIVSVSTYYPHTHPKVRCLDADLCRQRLRIDDNGAVHHPLLTDWSPVQSLKDVVYALCDSVSDLYPPGTHLYTSTESMSVEEMDR